jgi:hypothetical protein
VQAEYKIGKATVRMHGTPDRERLEAATLRFMQKVEQARRKQRKEGVENGFQVHG